MTTAQSSQQGTSMSTGITQGLHAKDGFATVMVGLTVLAIVAVLRDWDWPFLSSPRSGAVVVGVLGLMVCSGGSSYGPGQKGIYIFTASVLGVIALGLVIATFITKSQTLLIILGGDVVALWLLATIRHALGSPPSKS